ncbi:MAG: 16S rRNA (cytosine(1402)-N(4))-methyltransferase RsmH [Acidobacteria bacterium]|nr:16S rRNA (cytosine(1402)-N(4))-methyltransferase RsmH [Acidobacteriota bacterium]
MDGRSEPQTGHEPVMAAEVVTLLNPGRDGLFVDCTVGGGGHARALLAAGAGRLLGLDRDAEALSVAAGRLRDWGDRVDLAHTDFRKLEATLEARGIDDIDGGALADLGFSTLQLDGEGRGFSFRRDEPLDMRMDRSAGLTAADVLETASERELADVLFRFGEERHARRIARALVVAREREPMATTGQLAALVRRTLPRPRHWRIDPATRTFQALRIWVNRELDGLDDFLRGVCRRLRAGARLAVITFHSLEDRIVKHTLRDLERSGAVALRVLTRRPMRPSAGEVARNPRARSAKLRGAERLA